MALVICFCITIITANIDMKDFYMNYINADFYKSYELENNEFNYIIISILNNYNNELATYSELLLDNDVIFKRIFLKIF